MMDPADLTATEAASRIRDETLRPVELVEACLDRIEKRHDLNAFVHVDRALALRAAEGLSKNPARGALHGLPIAVKDVLDTCDMPTGYGSTIWSGHVPRSDAASVALARKAGAVIIGKTATTEFATRHPSAAVNPANPLHTPGGSSSGSAAAIAASLCPLAFGTQTAGSIIRPAAFCGIVGYKPTFGYIHRAGMKVMSETLDTIGALARTVSDCALLVAGITGRPLVPSVDSEVRQPRFALVDGPSRDARPETIARLHEVAETLRKAGAVVQECALPTELNAAYSAHPAIMNMEIADALTWECETHAREISDDLTTPIRWARALAPETLDEGRDVLLRAQAAFSLFMDQYDAVLTPSAVGEAPLGLDRTGDPSFNILWTALYAPCVHLPAGTGPAGLPLGVQLVGNRNADQRLLVLARWVEAQLG